MPPVSWLHVWRSMIEAGRGQAEPGGDLGIVDGLGVARLTGNTETIYGLASLDLKRDGPVVIEVPPSMLGAVNDLWQNSLADIGTTGVDKGKGGKFLVLPPEPKDDVPGDYIVVRSPTYCASLGVRGFQVDGETAPAVDLIKTTRIYPLSKADAPPPTAFVDASQQPVDTLFSDDSRFFEDLAWIVDREPADRFSDPDRFQLAAIGIERGKPFQPDAERRKLLDEAAQFAEAIARTNSFASQDDARLVYAGSSLGVGVRRRQREVRQPGLHQHRSPRRDSRTSRSACRRRWSRSTSARGHSICSRRATRAGAFLDGGKNYRLHLPSDIPVKNFWSVVAYDADSRSLLRNDQPFPSVSTYTGPKSNDDDSIDVFFGPTAPPGKREELDSDEAGQGMVRAVPLLRPARTVLRPDVEAGRRRPD